MKTEFQILCSSSCFFLLFLWGGYLHDGCCGHWGTPPVPRELFFPIRTKKLPLTGWSPKAVERNFLVHFGALGHARGW